jgi:farnesyl diphosphate synthase
MNNQETLIHDLRDFENHLNTYLSQLKANDLKLKEAITYVLSTPSKKFRAKLVYASGRIYQLDQVTLNSLALAIELIHAYSLVHDDLPAMDNDDWRRGQPSCHKAFDEATAILTGNALHHLAISHLLEQLPLSLDESSCIKILKQIFYHIGTQGILSGQSLDLHLLGQEDLSLSTLCEIHHLKTTALLQAIVESTWIAGKGSPEQGEILIKFVRHLGLAYQMLDDYGDQYATENWGKKQASDAKNQKHTFVYYFTQDELKQKVLDELSSARTTIQDIPNHGYLETLVNEVEQRIKTI